MPFGASSTIFRLYLNKLTMGLDTTKCILTIKMLQYKSRVQISLIITMVNLEKKHFLLMFIATVLRANNAHREVIVTSTVKRNSL